MCLYCNGNDNKNKILKSFSVVKNDWNGASFFIFHITISLPLRPPSALNFSNSESFILRTSRSGTMWQNFFFFIFGLLTLPVLRVGSVFVVNLAVRALRQGKGGSKRGDPKFSPSSHLRLAGLIRPKSGELQPSVRLAKKRVVLPHHYPLPRLKISPPLPDNDVPSVDPLPS